MRVSKEMMAVARDTLGYEVDAERVKQAFSEMPENYNPDLAKQKLKELEGQFATMGGRGVDLADEIDNLRIYLACYGMNVAKPYTVTVKVLAPCDLDREDVVHLVQRLIYAGQEDACASLDTDYDDPDTDDAVELECVVE